MLCASCNKQKKTNIEYDPNQAVP